MPVKLRARNVFKLFNETKVDTLTRLKRGESKEEIFRATGATVGINDVSFDVHEGEIFVIMGLSGSGKSTLVRTLNGLIAPTSGEIWVEEDDVASCSAERLREVRRRKIAMVFQHFALFPHKSVADNVAFGLKVKGMRRAERRAAALKALAQVGLEAHADSYPAQLSGGMQQRVGLARGLATGPEILLMDEPFGALDPLIRREMQDELVVLQKKLKKTIIFITHDLNEALLLGDRIAIMKDGAFVQVGTAQDIVADPADDYVRAFVADIDRSRVFSAADVALEPASVPIDATLSQALQAMKDVGSGAAHVLKEGAIAGIVTWRGISEAAPTQTVQDVMVIDAPVVDESALLHEMYDAAQTGLPVGVTDGDGTLVGVVPPEAIFAQLAPAAAGDPDAPPSIEDASSALPGTS
ncbi:glycine betaine/L-proline ABC transporter ATP-binding protein [Aurantimonas sp. DM33-3]|uniref:quaternary amine ABC transporter ATP-binding protein n=1 Tax=Aurantimonas sp. DM33-3 TaxID=2766955 RepID=UPI001651FE42|nr:glycine betaine/L-proline ABC transporter ATP-binding protein [Aurantimonas sp. DM33-3]MBC6718767.1 glycine betaine/L-proline ABC transporter ATP-binding protein [Aurantimonas sp. DM33-3]